MNRRLVYVIGPSGAGKDSLLAWLRARLDPALPIHWARRTISRPAQAGGEAHESVDVAAFEQLRDQQAFALHWKANGLHYGIRHAELAAFTAGSWVMVNGSRAYLPQAQAIYPGLTVLHITASADILRQRLLARGRETPEMIEARVQRAVDLRLPSQGAVLEVRNDSALDAAGERLLQALGQLTEWPRLPASPVATMDRPAP